MRPWSLLFHFFSEGRLGHRAIFSLSILLLASAGSWAQAPEFRINSYTSGIQQRPHIAAFSHGGFVVTWQSSQSPGADTSGSSILARRFDASASPVGPDFQVNTETTDSQTLAQVTSLSNDGFVVVWNIANTPLFRQGVGGELLGETGDTRGQLYDSAGNPVGSEFQVNAPGNYVTNYGHEVTANDQGGFAVVWNDFDDEVFLRPYDSLGNALADPILLASGECFRSSAVATGAGSTYVPSWQCRGESNDIHYRRFDSMGTPLAATQTAPAAARLTTMTGTDDGFLLAYDIDAATWFGQLFDSTGTATGSAFELSRELQYVVSGGAEGFTTVWYDGVPAGPNADRLDIKRGRFSASGGTLSPESQVNVFTTHDQNHPDVAALADGRFVVVWGSYFSNDDDTNWSIRARILTDELFMDGFEAGNTDAWSQVVP